MNLWDIIKSFFKKLWKKLTYSDDFEVYEARIKYLNNEIIELNIVIETYQEENEKLVKLFKELKANYKNLEKQVEQTIEAKEQLEKDLDTFFKLCDLIGREILEELVEKSNLVEE